MAEEKDKEASKFLSDYLSGGAKTKSDAETLSEVVKALAERGTTVKDASGLVEALKAILGVQEAAQKRAAETNVVDNALANTWFKEHWPEPRKCPICAHTNWAMAPNFAHVPLELIGRKPVGTYQPVRSFPCVVVACLTCGNQLFFNANAMGLLPAGSE